MKEGSLLGEEELSYTYNSKEASKNPKEHVQSIDVYLEIVILN